MGRRRHLISISIVTRLYSINVYRGTEGEIYSFQGVKAMTKGGGSCFLCAGSDLCTFSQDVGGGGVFLGVIIGGA